MLKHILVVAPHKTSVLLRMTSKIMHITNHEKLIKAWEE